MKNTAFSSRREARTLCSWAALLLSACVAASACGGVSEVKTNHSSGGSGGFGGNASKAGSAGNLANAGNAGSAGDHASDAGNTSTDVVCEDAARRCAGDVPQVCQAGAWVSEAACDIHEACSGAGVCAAFRLVGAGIGTLGERPAEPVAGASLILREQTLSAAPRVCNDKLCVTGDVR